ncbi:MAG: hypothetical protein K2X72_31435 [Reyranella sp.]|nr:hypothetical protein [Reyranella sp.]
MKSALDCVRNAERCEEMAYASYRASQRQMLLGIAKSWRSLGDAAKERERQAALRRYWTDPKET